MVTSPATLDLPETLNLISTGLLSDRRAYQTYVTQGCSDSSLTTPLGTKQGGYEQKGSKVRWTGDSCHEARTNLVA